MPLPALHRHRPPARVHVPEELPHRPVPGDLLVLAEQVHNLHRLARHVRLAVVRHLQPDALDHVVGLQHRVQVVLWAEVAAHEEPAPVEHVPPLLPLRKAPRLRRRQKPLRDEGEQAGVERVAEVLVLVGVEAVGRERQPLQRPRPPQRTHAVPHSHKAVADGRVEHWQDDVHPRESLVGIQVEPHDHVDTDDDSGEGLAAQGRPHAQHRRPAQVLHNHAVDGVERPLDLEEVWDAVLAQCLVIEREVEVRELIGVVEELV
mmetsp:Transcript_64512/g.172768  ORF Transcript_64512/g.172768 Transcript_64512/m.172768 type:complete len:261 (+) Transcript_64512:363-1145(+)